MGRGTLDGAQGACVTGFPRTTWSHGTVCWDSAQWACAAVVISSSMLSVIDQRQRTHEQVLSKSWVSIVTMTGTPSPANRRDVVRLGTVVLAGANGGVRPTQ